MPKLPSFIADAVRLRRRSYLFISSLCLIVALAGCTSKEKKQADIAAEDHDHAAGHSHDDGHDHEHADHEDDHEGHNHAEHEGHDHSDEEGESHHDHGSPQTTSGSAVAIPPQVRQNLGITLSQVETRRVASTVRLPGRFESQPSAVRVYHAPLAGRIELLVNQYDRISTGTPLYRVDSNEWRQMQQQLLAAHAEVMSSSASLVSAKIAQAGGASAKGISRQRIASAEAHVRSLQESIRVAEERVSQVQKLQSLVGGKLTELSEARSQLSQLNAELSKAMEDQAELNQQQIQLSTDSGSGAFATSQSLSAMFGAREAEYLSARARRDLIHSSLISILGAGNEKETTSAENWTLVPQIEVTAKAEGIVSQITPSTGAYVDASAPILTTINKGKLRFRAVALQTDLHQYSSVLTGRILAPGNGDQPGKSIPVIISPSIEADADARTIDLVANLETNLPWARPGLATELEIVLDATEDTQLAIPAAAIVQDGLEKIFFLRDREDPDKALRMTADISVSDGRWVAIKSGLKPDDQVVLDGAYELKLATASVPEAAGHFHADGTFHEGEH